MGSESAVYVRNAWYVASWAQDLEDDKPTAITILGERIVFWRAQGQLHALEDRCVHRNAPLSLGRCESGGRLRCMYHGFLYGPDGRVVEIPGQPTVPPNAVIRRYAIVERHSWIWIWMGEAATADESLIPPAVGFDDPDWILGRGFLDYEAEAQLIHDNLLDFSHLSYVHANSFGTGPTFAEDRPRLSALRRGVRFERWITGTPGPIGRKTDQLVDNWSSYDFLIPGILLMWSGSFPVGTAQSCNFERPDYSKAVAGVTFTSQAVTPRENRKARYFFSWGPHRQHGDEKLRDFLMGVAGQAFNEDKVMIEAQQLVLAANPNLGILPSAHDRGVIMYTQLVKRLAREEQSREAPAGKTAAHA